MASVDEKFQKYQDIQGDIQSLYLLKQQSLSQFNENTLVKGELELLEDSTAVFKLVGPVLMKVELEEAKENVKKRIEFIEGEIVKLDNQIADKQRSQTVIGDEIAEMQQKMQAEAAAAAKQVLTDV